MSLKFAVVREDPAVELALARQVRARRALVVASGGCTAFALAHALPGLEVVAYDKNPAQLAHAERKAEAVRQGNRAALNVGCADPAGLSQCGAFEGLFRILRATLTELVCGEELERFFAPGTDPAVRRRLLAGWEASPYWAAAFATAFNTPLLHAMFGPEATQHAAEGSYPGYFQRAFARGLARPDAASNPWLQSVLLGRYRPVDAPAWMAAGRLVWRPLLGGIPEMPGLGSFQLVHLSNIFDWSDDALVEAWLEALRQLPAGAWISIRQLNNARPLPLAPWFALDEARSAAFSAAERSLFYDRVLVARRTSCCA